MQMFRICVGSILLTGDWKGGRLKEEEEEGTRGKKGGRKGSEG